jgi:hypothetical protein
MTVLVFRIFAGEIPRLPHTLLPENAAQATSNCDLSHGELRGLHGNKVLYNGLVNGQQIKSVYSEDGTAFFAWNVDTWAVKSMVVDDIHYRFYYTQVLNDGPIAKMARTHRNTNGVIESVIGSFYVGGNFQPPEASTPGSGNGLGPDSWLLGVPRPKVDATSENDNLTLSMVDKPAWPGIPRLQLRVTFLLESPTGEVVAQHDITNHQHATVNPQGPVNYVNVWYDSNSAQRGNKIQDMLWPLGYVPRPYKYYWFNPPTFETQTIARTVTLTADAATSFTYEETVSTPPPGPGTEIPAYKDPGDVPGNE